MKINKAITFIRSLMIAAVVLGAGTLPAWAVDSVKLKSGEEVTGEIVREFNGNVWIQVKGEADIRFLTADQVDSISRDVGAPPPEADPKPDQPPAKDNNNTQDAAPLAAKAKPALSTPALPKIDTPKAVIITMEEMVGMYMTAHAIEEAIPLLEKDGVDIVVFRINSGGGALIEIQKLSDTIQEKYKPKFRVVAWIESAISAAAMTAHVIEEIYFAPEGNYGACTGYSGALNAMKGRELEEVIYMMEKISAKGKKDPAIMKAMQHFRYPLSCTINSRGDVEWYQNETGDHVVNPLGRVLTFDSQEAERFGFSRGTARTLEELEKAMGLTEVEWVGDHVRGYIWPISRAEKLQMDFREKTKKDETSLNEYWDLYQAALGIAQGMRESRDRGKFIAKAREGLERIKAMVKNNPNHALFTLGFPGEKEFWLWIDEQEEILRKLS